MSSGLTFVVDRFGAVLNWLSANKDGLGLVITVITLFGTAFWALFTFFAKKPKEEKATVVQIGPGVGTVGSPFKVNLSFCLISCFDCP
jgi:hypothetical protein